MTNETAFHFDNDGSRPRLTALFAMVLVVAQMIFAAHVGAAFDPLTDHSGQTCETCLAGAVAADPFDLAVNLAAPSRSFVEIAQTFATQDVIESVRLSAKPRGPPFN